MLMLGGIVCPFIPGAAAQAPFHLQPLSPAAQARAGVHLLQRGRPAAAQQWLRRAVRADSSLMMPDYGAAAYWLGEAYARTGDSAAAHAAWSDGLHRLHLDGHFDVRLADAYLRSLTLPQLRAHRLQAVDQYRRLLGHVGPDTTAAVAAVFRRRVAQLVPLLPDDVLASVISQKRSAAPSTWSFRPNAGAALRRWWRRRDPFPNTPENERLEEHLTRLVRARRAYACPERPSTLDGRGRVLVRLGAPDKRRRLQYQGGEFFRNVFRAGVPIPPSGFPDAEIWLYPQIDESTYYLFAEGDTSNCYHVATANDLLPSTLKIYRGNSERGLNIAYSSLMAMRAIYQELALFHPDFGPRYSKIANYAGWQELKATVARMGLPPGGATRQTTVGAGVGQTRIVSSNPVLGIPSPTDFVGRVVSRAKREDRRAARERKAATPRQHTALHEESPRLPVAVRTARSLTPDGRTQTTIYWGVPIPSLALQKRDTTARVPSALSFSAVQYDASWANRLRRHRHYQLPASFPDRSRGFVPPPLTLAPPSSETYHLSLQWTQYRRWTRAAGPTRPLGPKRRFALSRIDSLRTLRARGPIEMSDVMVQSVPDTAARPAAQLSQATPYPFRTVTPDTPLLLSFELYHLARNANDRTRYTIAYEVRGRTRPDGRRFFQSPTSQRTTTKTTETGTARRTQERILLDLSEIARGTPQDVRVTVRVTDEVTGATAARTVNFILPAAQ